MVETNNRHSLKSQTCPRATFKACRHPFEPASAWERGSGPRKVRREGWWKTGVTPAAVPRHDSSGAASTEHRPALERETAGFSIATGQSRAPECGGQPPPQLSPARQPPANSWSQHTSRPGTEEAFREGVARDPNTVLASGLHTDALTFSRSPRNGTAAQLKGSAAHTCPRQVSARRRRHLTQQADATQLRAPSRRYGTRQPPTSRTRPGGTHWDAREGPRGREGDRPCTRRKYWQGVRGLWGLPAPASAALCVFPARRRT